MDGELRWWFTLGHTPIISDGFSEAPLSTLGHTPLIDDIFFRDDALHWGIASLLLSHWIMVDQELLDDPTLGHGHFKERFYWRYSHSTRCSALGHVPLMTIYFEAWPSHWWRTLIFHWSIVTSDGLYWGIASSFVLIELEDSDSYGLCWEVSIFSTRSRDWLICWLGCIALL